MSALLLVNSDSQSQFHQPRPALPSNIKDPLPDDEMVLLSNRKIMQATCRWESPRGRAEMFIQPQIRFSNLCARTTAGLSCGNATLIQSPDPSEELGVVWGRTG